MVTVPFLQESPLSCLLVDPGPEAKLKSSKRCPSLERWLILVIFKKIDFKLCNAPKIIYVVASRCANLACLNSSKTQNKAKSKLPKSHR